jgi:putative protease
MIELLAPAGNPEALDAAIGEGADAVYLGLRSFNARMRSANFAWNQFEAAVATLHKKGKKIYVTVNTVCEEGETERLYRFLGYLDRIGPDGIIVQDFGVLRMVQEFFPGLKVHASTQMNIASARAVNLLSREGVKRVVLARELSIQEIRDIKASTSSELEVFVHGALCVSQSGLCLFSSYLGGKSANRGMCAQACRRLYTAETPGGEAQGYFFSPNDLCLIAQVPGLIAAGVDAFKIEGRMKSAEYVGSVTAAYRYLIDYCLQGKDESEGLKGALAVAERILAMDFGRKKTSFWYDYQMPAPDNPASLAEGAAPDSRGIAEAALNPGQAGGTGIFLGAINRTKTLAAPGGEKQTYATIQGGNYDPDQGDSIRLHRKDDTGRESHKVKEVFQDKGERWIDIPPGFSSGDPVYLLQTKAMSKRYDRVLPKDLHPYRSQPDDRILPVLDLTTVQKNELAAFPEGFYIGVSTLKDLAVALAEHPVRVVLELNYEIIGDLLSSKTLPVSKKQLFLSLDPFCPQGLEKKLAPLIDQLLAEGYTNWIVNNPAHITMLRGKNAFCIAGPYLYTFNRWAVSWLENCGLKAFITPIENSRSNLEAAFDKRFRSRVMITLLAYPALFRMRFQLPNSYDFTYFYDKEEGLFKALSTADGSFILPENPFSIVDMYSSLKNAGFSRFFIDLTKIRVLKKDIRQIFLALQKGSTLPDTSRFNWKDGFYSKEKIDSYRSQTAKTGGKEKSRRTRKPRQPVQRM